MTTQANIPQKWFVPFAQGDGARVEIPVTTADPTRASQTLGFPPLTMQPPESGGVPPQGEDFNGGMNQIARVAWWMLNGGGWPYDAAFATNANILGYPNGATLQSADFRGDWINTVDGNQNNPDTLGTNWVPGFQYGVTTLSGLTGGAVTPTPAQAAKNSITLTGTLTSALTVILPAWLKTWRITNSTTGAFVTIVKTAAGSGVTIPQNSAPTLVTGDGTNIVQVGENVAAATTSTQAMQFGQATGRLLRTTIYRNNAGTLQSSVDGAVFANVSSTFTPQALTTKVDVEVQAAGGGGGGSTTTNASQISAGAGGGGGGFSRGVYTTGFAGVTVAVGLAGAGGTPGVTGSAGGASSFGTLCTATGGGGGAAGSLAATGGPTVPVGSGTPGVGSSGQINKGGTSGGYALYSNTSAISGGGGNAGDGGGGGIFVGPANSSGTASSSPGAGGSGGTSPPSAVGATGGGGGGGYVVVKEYV